MASHKSALKRIKQTRKRTATNRMHRTQLRHQIGKLRAALDAKDKAAAEVLLRPTLELIAHSTHKGILHRNTAARYTSRLTLRFNALG
ncbi:MAG: 30S ribosomal protein S20 [Acidobacteria bacterium]|nr:30S ribosomal protein S20 [Acidobacteriota bacterium]